MINIFSIAKKYRGNPRQVLDEIIYRWSPRNMDQKEVLESDLFAMFEAASYAPSAFNNQPERFYYSKAGSKSFSELLQILALPNQGWCKNASYLMILVSKNIFEHNGKPNRTHSFDTGAAWEALAIEGTKRNLVVHAMSGFDFDKAKEYLKLGDDYQVECMIAVGAASGEIENEKITLRRPINEIAIQLDS